MVEEVSFHILGFILILSVLHQHYSISQTYITLLVEMKTI